MHIDLQCTYLRPIMTKTGICRQIFVKLTNIKFHGNPFSLSQLFRVYSQVDKRSGFNKTFARMRKNVNTVGLKLRILLQAGRVATVCQQLLENT
jgi:hypothetical protein